MSLESLLGRATGIGSLPYSQPEAALNLIFSRLKHVPHWPQLPKRGDDEGLVNQYLSPLLQGGLIEAGEGSPYFRTDSPDWDRLLLEYLEALVAPEGGEDGERFAFPPRAAAGFYAFLERGEEDFRGALAVKGQLSGPVTVGFQVTDARRKPAFYSDELREVLVHTLAKQARWQAERLARTGRPVLIFLDDPSIYHYGSSTSVGLGREEIQESLGLIMGEIRAAGALVGVHCCAGVDWSLLLELSPEVISFDAYDYLTSLAVYGDLLNSFLKQGGVLAWGLVPTSEAVLQEDGSSLMRRLLEGMEFLARRGVDRTLLGRRLMFTPSCGTGTLSEELAGRVYDLVAALAAEYAQEGNG
ncbi:MAG TPA: hypothetical protein PLY18_02710 [Bacillota bacterium]|nr:hypothetical protein [Bacillota bacterium]